MYSFLKRIIDVIISTIGIIVLFPFLILIAVLIRLESKGCPIFKQKRLGREQKEFVIYKFRTMIENAYELGGIVTSESDCRITRVGRFLRRTSIDEIPQLFNILLGQMSIVGPRPILKEEFEPYKDNVAFAQRFLVRPGLFCIVDIDYRATADRELQFFLDVQYVEQLGLLSDIRIFVKVFFAVLHKKNIYKEKINQMSEK